MSLKALKQKRADLIAEADRLFASADAEGRVLTEAEMKRDDEITAELLAMNSQIERAERQAERARALDLGAGPADANAIVDAAAAAARNGKNSFSSLGSQLLAVAAAGVKGGPRDTRLQWTDSISAATGLSEGVGADGGFLVQTDFQTGLLQNMWSSGELLTRVRRIGISANSNGIAMNGVDETSRVNGSRWGGVRVYWVPEFGQYTAAQAKFRKIKMDLEKLTGLFYATEELLRDAQALEAWMMMAFEEEMRFVAEDAIMQGLGSGQPLGYMNSAAVVTVTKEGSQANGTIVAENVLKMFARMPARMIPNAVWLVNQDTFAQLNQLNVKIKNVAGTENVGGIMTPIYQAPAAGQLFGTLLGRPVIPVEYAATLGTVGDIQFVDLSQYLMIDKGGVTSQSSVHVRFLFDETAFKFTYRVNGQPMHNAAITPYKGTNTQSPYIVLQAR